MPNSSAMARSDIRGLAAIASAACCAFDISGAPLVAVKIEAYEKAGYKPAVALQIVCQEISVSGHRGAAASMPRADALECCFLRLVFCFTCPARTPPFVSSQ